MSMKNFLWLIIIASITFSCETAKLMYDDVYEAAEFKSVSDDGYADLIKDSEKNHKVVVDKEERTTFGGYYLSDQTGGTSFTDHDRNCNLPTRCYHSNFNFLQPAWVYSNRYDPFWNNGCSCGYTCGSLSYHNISFGNMYSLYGYYDYWGAWHSYYPWGYDPYGYYAFYYGWNGNYYNNNYYTGNGWFGNWNNSNTGSNNTTYSGGNHFYGHRNSSSSASSNTTAYEHTVKGVAFKPTNTTFVSANQSGQEIAESNNSNVVHLFPNNEFSSEPAVVPAGNTAVTAKPLVSGGTSTTYTNEAVVEKHVPASNQFEVKYPVGTAARTGGGQSTTQSNTPAPSNQSETRTGGYTYTPPTNTTSSNTNSNSTSRSSGTTTTNTGGYYYNTNTNSGSNNTTSSHRSTTSTTSGSSSSSSSSSGGSRTTTTSTSRR